MVDVRQEHPGWPASWWRWFAACTAGEVLGIAAAAGAAAMGAAIVGEPTTVGAAVVVVVFATVGGCVEGLAVGSLQWRVFRTWIPALSPGRYIGGTVGLAAAFWLLGTLPSTVLSVGGASDAGASSDPPVIVMVLVAGAGGAVGGCAFGAVQGWALTGHVTHPWRWIRPNAVGWAVAVAVITVGASVAPAGMPTLLLVAYGAGVGLLAGACVGAITAQAVPSLDLELPLWNRVVADLLLSPLHPLLSQSVMLVRFTGRRSGRTITLPVQYAMKGDCATVYAAHAARKSWWRSFAVGQLPVTCVIRGARLAGSARLVPAGTDEHAVAAADYRARWPRVQVDEDAVLLQIDLAEPTRRAPDALPAGAHG
jgi:hypothetical protein